MAHITFTKIGDWYESFDEDAILVSKELQITLQKTPARLGEPRPLCGVPYHAIYNRVAELESLGHTVTVA